MNSIITFSGPARAGKDYIAEKLAEALPGAKLYTLADLVKEYICELLEIDLDTLNKLKNSNHPFTTSGGPGGYGITMRTFIQRFATEIFVNKVDEHYWVKAILKRIMVENPQYAIITDVRFKHEMAVFKSWGSYSIYIKGDTVIPESTHISENDLNGYEFDFEYDNSKKGDVTPFIENLVMVINKRGII